MADAPKTPAPDDLDLCQVSCLHQETVDRVLERMLPGPELEGLAEGLKLLADPTRLTILHALEQDELCVCDLAHILNMQPSAVSHQLRLLRMAGLVAHRRQGKMALYRLAPDTNPHAPLLRAVLALCRAPGKA